MIVLKVFDGAFSQNAIWTGAEKMTSTFEKRRFLPVVKCDVLDEVASSEHTHHHTDTEQSDVE